MKILNKKIVLPIILTILFLLALPSKAKAFVFLGIPLAVWAIGGLASLVGIGALAKFGPGIAGDIGNNILIALINVMFQIPLIITGTLNFVAAALVAMVIDPNFLGVRITGPENAVVYNAWRFVRDFANMGFILALVAIGLGTALKYGEYQLQKALPRLLIIALLINFTPVLVGLLIDAANITIGFLVGETVGKNLLAMSKLIYGASGALASSFGRDYTEVVAAAIAQIFFNLLSTLINLLFFLLFFFRYVALMLLFILSPLAFFSWILPATRGFWNLWWRQFISWLLVGVFGAFFLLLSAQMTHFMWDATLDIPPDIEGQAKSFSNFFAVFLVASLPLAFLWLGFLITISTSAMGAQGIIRMGKTAGVWARKKAWKQGTTYAKEKWQKSPAAERISRRLSQAQAPKEVRILGLKVPVVSQVAKWGAATSAAAERTIGRAGLAAREIGISDVGREEEEAKKRGVEMKVSHLLSPEKTKTQRVATLLATHAQDQLKPLERLLPEEKRDSIIKQIGREAMEIHPEVFKRFAKAYPEVAAKTVEDFPKERREAAGMTFTDEQEEKKYHGNIVEKTMDKMSPEDIGKMAPSSLANIDIKEAMHEFWGGPQIAAAARAFSRKFVEEFNEGVQIRGKDWYDKHNPKVPTYVHRTTAQELGFQDPLKLTHEGVPPPGASVNQRLEMASKTLAWLKNQSALTPEQTEMRDALSKRVDELETELETIKKLPKERPPEKKKRWAGRKYK